MDKEIFSKPKCLQEAWSICTGTNPTCVNMVWNQCKIREETKPKKKNATVNN